jgi:DNA primase
VRLAKDGTIAVRCHGCGATGDALSLIAQVRGLNMRTDFREVLRVAGEIAGAPVPADATALPKTPEPNPEGVSDETYDAIWTGVLEACSPLREVSPRTAAYLRWRGLEVEAEADGLRGLPTDARPLVRALLDTFDRKELELAGVLRPGHDAIDWPEWPLLVPWRSRFGRIQCMQRRRVDNGSPKYRSPRGRAPRTPFGVHLLVDALAQSARAEVILAEGALDCLARRAIARGRGEASVVLGVYSAASPERGLPIDLLDGRRVVLALDNDAAGDRACDRLAEVLRFVAAELIRERPPVGPKDWAEALAGAAQ